MGPLGASYLEDSNQEYFCKPHFLSYLFSFTCLRIFHSIRFSFSSNRLTYDIFILKQRHPSHTHLQVSSLVTAGPLSSSSHLRPFKKMVLLSPNQYSFPQVTNLLSMKSKKHALDSFEQNVGHSLTLLECSRSCSVFLSGLS